MDAPTTVARVSCDQPTARRLAGYLGESLDPDTCACAAFEDERGQWQVAIHFRGAPDQAAVRSLAALAAGESVAAAIVFEPVAPADWVAKSLAGLTPVRAGRFIVHGAHDRARVRPNDIAIEIEAALAFGTGHHGTTRGCLLALDDLAKKLIKRRHAGRVLDLGTGSGVLAIAAAKILRRPVVATDIDRLAVQSARANARLNRAGLSITLACATGTRSRAITAAAPYDLIFANILLGPLLRLAVPLRQLAGANARIVLSGLLPAHANATLAAYRMQGLALERRITLDGWVTLVLKNP